MTEVTLSSCRSAIHALFATEVQSIIRDVHEPAEAEPELATTLKQSALACWILFGFSGGYARIDFRVDPTGSPFIIDVNPNPYLSPDAEDAAAAAQAGLSYQDLIASIVESSFGFSQDSARHSSRLRIA